MKSLVAHGNGHLSLEDLKEIDILPDEILVAPIATGVCGTDLEIIDGKIAAAFVRYPIVLGHEWCGRVVKIGSAVNTVDVGARVVTEGIIPCGTCFECLGDHTNRCITYEELGFTKPGAAADQVVVNAKFVHLIADSVSNESAVLVEPTAVVTQGLLKVQPARGAKILVIGDGTIGLIAARVAHAWNPSVVHMVGLKEGQAALAKEAGVELFMTASPTEKYDLIIDASGASSRITDAVHQLVRGGSLLLLGFTGPDVKTCLSIDDVVNSDLTITASFGYSRKAWEMTVGFLNSGKLDLTFLVTHRYPLGKYQDAIDALRTAPSPRGKIIFEIGN